MAKLNSKRGKGKYKRYSDDVRWQKNKEIRTKTVQSHLQKRKEWRIKKYKPANLVDYKKLSGTTRKLFAKWGVAIRSVIIAKEKPLNEKTK